MANFGLNEVQLISWQCENLEERAVYKFISFEDRGLTISDAIEEATGL